MERERKMYIHLHLTQDVLPFSCEEISECPYINADTESAAGDATDK